MKNHSLKIVVLMVILAALFSSNTWAQLPPFIYGFVTDPNGNPVEDADLDFDDAVTGERLPTPGDNTDSSGFYQLFVLPGVYHISFAPPPNSNLVGKRFYNVNLPAGAQLELNVTLDFGKIISGTVKDEQNNPVGGVDLDADNLTTGRRIYTPNDNSDSLTGAYWIVVPPDFYRLRFEPPAGTLWKGVQFDTIDVRSNVTLNIILEEGFLLSGIVSDTSNQGVDSISIDLRDQVTGDKIFVANNKTDSTGSYAVAVPGGLFQLRFEPPRGSRYVGAAIDSFAISGDIVHNQVLHNGFILTTIVTDSLDNPIPGADIDLILQGTGEKIFTPYDNTDSLGTASFAVLPDTYAVRAQPPPGTLFDTAFMDSVVISSDTSLSFQLGEVDRVNLQGMVKDIADNGLPGIAVNLIDQFTGNMLLSADNQTDSLGFYDIDVPLGTFDAVFMPPRGEKVVGLKIYDVTFEADTVWDDIVLDSGYVFTAAVYKDVDGLAVENTRFRFSLPDSGEEVFAPNNITDIYGTCQVALLPDSYSVEIIPPNGTGFIPPVQIDLGMLADTSLVIILRTQAGPLPRLFFLRQNFPNPFNASTIISYVLFEQSRVNIAIYNSLGQKVISYDRGNVNTGEHSVVWDGTDRYGNRVSSGVYFYRLETFFGDKKKKMLLIK
jgi:hypothetical protein